MEKTASSLIIVDLLTTDPSPLSFEERVEHLRVSGELKQKAIAANLWSDTVDVLTEADERELSQEVLLQRHRFTDLLFTNSHFRQAAITVIQNIYLFKQRRIFLSSRGASGEQERQEALLLLSDQLRNGVPISKTFQHAVIARVWNRISSSADHQIRQSNAYKELVNVVEQLNTLRNIYMVLTTRLVRKLTRRVSSLYQQSLTDEDVQQIGSMGVARAAYRYDRSAGGRFSTYATGWILKEIQRQSLDGRLVKISSYMIEQLSAATRAGDEERRRKIHSRLQAATVDFDWGEKAFQLPTDRDEEPSYSVERQQLFEKICSAMENTLSIKKRDILCRRFGIGPYRGEEQSVIEIAREYGVTRGSIYQLEKDALSHLRSHLISIE